MVDEDVLALFHRTLVEEIRERRPTYLSEPFTVAEIYQNLVPYKTHRDRLGVEMNGDYEDALLRLLAGEGGYLILESDPALRELREELASSNPNTGLYREFAAVDVRLDPARLPHPAPAADGPEDTEWDVVPVGALAPLDGSMPRGGSGSEVPPERGAVPEREPARPSTGAASAGGSGVEPGSPETCVWCRADLPARPKLNFCPFCGTDVRFVPCHACGEELEPGWRFCAGCGAEVSG